jgi:hypothetical protein
VPSVKEALVLIPSLRDALNATDDELAGVIREVEDVLGRLRIGVPVEISYETPDGRFFLGFNKWDGKWQIVYGSGDDDETKDTVLVSAARHVRAEAFVPEATTGFSPIERLIIAIPDALVQFTQERSPALEGARRLVAVLKAARLE